jgi:hypothetical protein
MERREEGKRNRGPAGVTAQSLCKLHLRDQRGNEGNLRWSGWEREMIRSGKEGREGRQRPRM